MGEGSRVIGMGAVLDIDHVGGLGCVHLSKFAQDLILLLS